jgi:uncharacterized lipoprotein YajG
MKLADDPLRSRLKTRWLVVVSSFLVLFVSGCATVSETVLVSLRPYQPQPRENVSPTEPTGKVRIEPVRDARANAVGGLIGERKTVGNISMGSIEVRPLPADVIAQLLRAEFTRMGYSIVDSAEQLVIEARLRSFQVTTSATAPYWDVNGTIELDLTVTAQTTKYDVHYVVTCTDRTYLWPSEEIIGKVISACVGSMGTKVRSDAKLAKLIGSQ